MPGSVFQPLFSKFIPAPNPVVSGANPPVATASGGWVGTYFNETAVLSNNAVVTSIGMYSDAAATLTMKIVKKNSSTSVDVLLSQALSHPGGGWADVALTTMFVVPGTGSYLVGAFFGTSPTTKYNSSNVLLNAATNISGAGQTVAESTGAVPSFRATYG